MLKNLGKIRKEAGLSQEQLAAKLGIVRTQVAKWENGDESVSLRWLKKLSAILDFSIADLIGESPTRQEDDLIWQVFEAMVDQARGNQSLDKGLLTAIGKAVYRAAADGKLASVKPKMSSKKMAEALLDETARLIEYESGKTSRISAKSSRN